ncbi:MAG: hypothetical protein ABIG63_00790 [Chloroflexota bacterium]
MIRPVIEITQKGTGWSEIVWQVYILISLIVLLGVVLAFFAKERGLNNLPISKFRCRAG